MPDWAPALTPVDAAVTVVNATVMLRPSAASSRTPPRSSPVSMARTPVWPAMALIASVTSVRLAALLVVVVIAAVAWPLMVMLPVAAAAVCAAPVITVLPTTAETPVWALARLIAAALATAEADFSLDDTLSSSADDAPMVTPLITRSEATSDWLADRLVIVASKAPVADSAAVAPVPRSVARDDPMLSFTVSPARLPVCNWTLRAEPSSNLMPLKLVREPMLSISLVSCLISACIALRSSPVTVPLLACTDSSRMRCSMFVTSPIALSAVCARLMPSLALRIATARPRTSAVMRCEIARPAASSLAELMRWPVESRSIAIERPIWDVRCPACAVSAERLVLITVMRKNSCASVPRLPWGSRGAVSQEAAAARND